MINEAGTTTIEYSLEELKMMLTKPPYLPEVKFEGAPVHEIMSSNFLPGEVFRKGIIELYDIKDTNYARYVEIGGSNFGRVKYNGQILEQEIKDKTKDYLIVKIQMEKITLDVNVYNIIAKLWCNKPINIQCDVHHISNNGFDNRPSNLIWLEHDFHFNKVHK